MDSRQSPVADALRTLALNEARWAAVFNSAQDAIISIDRRGTITLFNRAAENIFGYTPAEVLGRTVTMLMPPPYCDEHDQYLRNYQQTGVMKAIGQVRMVEARRKSGEVFPIELSVSEARVDDDVIYSAIIRDITERQRAHRELERLRELATRQERLADIGAITATLVHDLGNPLSAVSMQTQLLIRRLRSGTADLAAVLPVAERVLAAVHRLDGIIHEFASFSREQRLDLRDIALPDFLRELHDLWVPLASSRGIDVLVDLPAQLPVVRADVEKLSRVLENLVKNAIEAIDQGPGCVTIRAVLNAPAGEVRISVLDTGPGVPSSVEVFGLFETTKPEGTGLGLPVAQQLVVAHGGRITHEALLPHGTAFHIDLPTRGPAV